MSFSITSSSEEFQHISNSELLLPEGEEYGHYVKIFPYKTQVITLRKSTITFTTMYTHNMESTMLCRSITTINQSFRMSLV